MIDFDVSEIFDLAHDLQIAGPRVAERAQLVVEKTGNDTVSDAQAICPVDTGNLRSTIGVDFDADGLGFEAGPTANYGHFVHWGTSRMAPQPYLIPPFERRVALAFEVFEEIAGDVF